MNGDGSILEGNRTVDVVRRIAEEVAAPAAAAVDRDARFPIEAVTSLRLHGLLGVSVAARERRVWTVEQLADAARILGASCSSTGMIWAMHHSQQIAVARHGAGGPGWDDIRRRLAVGDVLLASVASEGSGDLLASEAALRPEETGLVSVVKRASTVSFARDADAFLVSCRPSPDAKPSEVVLAYVWADQCELTSEGGWNALGMRGTASVPVTLTASFPPGQVFDDTFEAIYGATVVPVAHILWAGCWLGIAEAALDQARTRQRRAHRTTGSAHLELSEAAGSLDGMRALLAEGTRRYDHLRGTAGPPSLTSVAWFNELKVRASSTATAVVLAALRVVGLTGYLEASPTGLARRARDVLSAELMINNHRLRDANATIELIRRDDT